MRKLFQVAFLWCRLWCFYLFPRQSVDRSRFHVVIFSYDLLNNPARRRTYNVGIYNSRSRANYHRRRRRNLRTRSAKLAVNLRRAKEERGRYGTGKELFYSRNGEEENDIPPMCRPDTRRCICTVRLFRPFLPAATPIQSYSAWWNPPFSSIRPYSSRSLKHIVAPLPLGEENKKKKSRGCLKFDVWMVSP